MVFKAMGPLILIHILQLYVMGSRIFDFHIGDRYLEMDSIH